MKLTAEFETEQEFLEFVKWREQKKRIKQSDEESEIFNQSELAKLDPQVCVSAIYAAFRNCGCTTKAQARALPNSAWRKHPNIGKVALSEIHRLLAE